MHVRVSAVCVSKSQRPTLELVHPFHHLAARDQTQDLSLGGKHLRVLSHLVSLRFGMSLHLQPRLAWNWRSSFCLSLLDVGIIDVN